MPISGHYWKQGTEKNRKHIYKFSLDEETEDRKNLIEFQWLLIHQAFKTKDFYRARKSLNIVSNVLRHMVNWINKNYNLERPIHVEVKHKYTKIPDTNKRIGGSYTLVSF